MVRMSVEIRIEENILYAGSLGFERDKGGYRGCVEEVIIRVGDYSKEIREGYVEIYSESVRIGDDEEISARSLVVTRQGDRIYVFGET